MMEALEFLLSEEFGAELVLNEGNKVWLDIMDTKGRWLMQLPYTYEAPATVSIKALKAWVLHLRPSLEKKEIVILPSRQIV